MRQLYVLGAFVLCSGNYLNVQLPSGLEQCEPAPDLGELHKRIAKNKPRPHDGVLNIKSFEDYTQLFNNTASGKQRALVVLAFHTEKHLQKLPEIGHAVRFSVPDMCAPARMNVDENGYDLAEKFKITKQKGGGIFTSASTVLENDVVIVGIKRGSSFEDPVFTKIGFDFKGDGGGVELQAIPEHFLPSDSELYQKQMSVEAAKKSCLENEECGGITFNGDEGSEPTIFFKNRKVGAPGPGPGWTAVVKATESSLFRSKYDQWMGWEVLPVKLTFENGINEDIRIFRDNGNEAQLGLQTVKPGKSVIVDATVGQVFHAKSMGVEGLSEINIGSYGASYDHVIHVKPGGPDGSLISKSMACSTANDLEAYDNGTRLAVTHRMLPLPLVSRLI
jgi:hypothetical protein